MSLITLLGRTGCHLCEAAHSELLAIQIHTPFELVVTDVDTDPELRAEYGDQVPVVLVNGVPISFFRVQRAQVLAALHSADG